MAGWAGLQIFRVGLAIQAEYPHVKVKKRLGFPLTFSISTNNKTSGLSPHPLLLPYSCAAQPTVKKMHAPGLQTRKSGESNAVARAEMRASTLRSGDAQRAANERGGQDNIVAATRASIRRGSASMPSKV